MTLLFLKHIERRRKHFSLLPSPLPTKAATEGGMEKKVFLKVSNISKTSVLKFFLIKLQALRVLLY